MYRFTLCAGNLNSLVTSPIMTTKKGQPVAISEKLCKVVWIIEADLAAGQGLYLSGDVPILGCWEPDLAILMSSTENPNLWKAEVKVASGENFRYNYFVKAGTEPSCDVVWRPGPIFSLSVPLSVKEDRKVLVRDSWTTSNIKKPQPHIWGSWIEEMYFPVEPIDCAPTRDEKEIAGCLQNGVKESKPFLIDLRVKEKSYSSDALKPVGICDGSNHSTFFSIRNQPIEEPWLSQSLVDFLAPLDNETDAPEKVEVVEDNEAILDLNNQHHQLTEKLFPEERISLNSNVESVSAVILINSSVCTVQRIAVLEDEKLVELLLEPVKSNVQCDSVYLGVVTKLVPHMGGAFVNIGNSRHSFMDIKHNREPFIFPPFRQRLKKQEINGSATQTLDEHLASHENGNSSYGVEVVDNMSEAIIPDSSLQFLDNDYEEQEFGDDFEISVLSENGNGSMIDYGGAEADVEDCIDGEEHHIEGESIKSSLPVEIEDSNGSQISSDMKDSKQKLSNEKSWAQVRKGTKIIVQVVKEGLGTKGPTLTAYPKLRSRFWVLITQCNRVGVSKKISGVERTRLKVIAKTLQPQGFGLTVRTVAAGHSLEELQKDLEGLLSTWKNITEHAKSAALAADEGIEGAIPVLLHRAMGQTLSVVQDYFNEKVEKMVVDSPRTHHEVTNYLQEIAPDLCNHVELYDKRIPLFDQYNIEEEINNILSKRVALPNGGSLVIEQTEALVSIDVNGGHGMFGHGTSQEKAILDVNLAAARQIARELRLRDIGGIIVVDFIDMADESNKRLVYEEVKKAVERDRSTVKVSELSRHGLMEITRKRVRPSVTFMVSEPCDCCHATGRVEALETTFSKIEQEICRLLAKLDKKADPEDPKSWPRFILRVDNYMCNYLTGGKRARLAILSSSLKVWILLKVARGFSRGTFEVKPFADEKTNNKQVAISMLRPAESRANNSGKKVTLIPVKKGKAGSK